MTFGLLYTIDKDIHGKESRETVERDHVLIRKMRQGDEEAFNLFVHKYYEDILRYCRYHSDNREDAKDLTQDTFLRFFQEFSGYSHVGKVKNYLYTIARNLCNNHYKKKQVLPLEYVENEGGSEGEENNIIAQITVRACLDQLPDEFREVLILYYYQNLKQSEIAEILGIGLPLVKYRLKKAKEQMQKLL